MGEVATLAEGRIISLGGKTLRGSRASKETTSSIIHMVSAWCTHHHLVLGQRKVDDKSNEITAIPALLELLVVKGCLVTIDALGGQLKIAERYYISSKQAFAQYFSKAVRAHWQVENKLHRTLDVIFSEDASKKRAGNSAQNFSLIQRVALNMIGQHKDIRKRGTKKISVKRKRKMGGWNNDYLLDILLTLNYSA